MSSYTFDTFVVGDGTRLAFDAAVAVAEKSDAAHNPLALFGPTRSGKTHLLYAIERVMRARRPNAKIMRVPAQELIDQMINALRRDGIRRFRESVAALGTAVALTSSLPRTSSLPLPCIRSNAGA